MKTDDLLEKSIIELHNLLSKGEISHLDLLNSVIRNINRYEDKVKAYITIDLERAADTAKNLNKNSQDSLLCGIPISVKDTFTTEGVRTTVASRILESFISPYDATSYARLKEKGAVLLGKTNMDEFAHGFTTEYSAFSSTNNPWDLDKVPGGSSGGSAASVAAREAVLSLASENFGSIIQPASLCGVVGIKPTYGCASRYGLIAMVSSLECPGIIGKCVEDVAIGMTAISGKDPKDLTTINMDNEDLLSKLSRKIKGGKIAVVENFLNCVDSEISRLIKDSVEVYKKLGVKTGYIKWDDFEVDFNIYEVLYRAEVASNLARYDGLRFGFRDIRKHKNLQDYYIASRDVFGNHVKRQIITDPITLDVKSETESRYIQALKVRRLRKDFFDSILKKYDVIVTPTTVFTSLEKGSTEDKRWRDQNRELGKIIGAIMCPTALYGYPAITFPIGLSETGMPIGLQMYSARLSEQKLFDYAYSFQEETKIKCLKPKLLE